jgi:hypothetical protein
MIQGAVQLEIEELSTLLRLQALGGYVTAGGLQRYLDDEKEGLALLRGLYPELQYPSIVKDYLFQLERLARMPMARRLVHKIGETYIIDPHFWSERFKAKFVIVLTEQVALGTEDAFYAPLYNFLGASGLFYGGSGIWEPSDALTGYLEENSPRLESEKVDLMTIGDWISR